MTSPAIELLLERLAAARREIEARGTRPWHGYWQRPENAPPAPTSGPASYDGGARLAIGAGKGWVAALPPLANVRELFVSGRVTQELFEAACAMPALESLWIGSSAIKDLAALRGARNLRRLHIGSAPAVDDLSPLAASGALEWLELENLKGVRDLGPLAGLRGLEGLAFRGSEGAGNAVDSLWPLAGLTQLRWLHLGGLRSRDDSLAPLAALTGLDWLGLGNFFPLEECARLRRALPETECARLHPFEALPAGFSPCRKCRQATPVLATGRGGRVLCPECDAAALAAHLERWDTGAAP